MAEHVPKHRRPRQKYSDRPRNLFVGICNDIWDDGWSGYDAFWDRVERPDSMALHDAIFGTQSSYAITHHERPVPITESSPFYRRLYAVGQFVVITALTSAAVDVVSHAGAQAGLAVLGMVTEGMNR